MVFKYARMGFPLKIGGRADESVPFVERASLNAPLQWKLGQSKISILSALEKLCSRSFYGNKRSTPLFHWG